MKGVILAGGKGTRLKPFTDVTNKHLAQGGNKLMIDYPIETLKRAGLEDILIIVGGKDEYGGDVMNYLGSGKKYGVHFTYKVQDEAGGIAQALSLAKEFVGDDNIAVILGDNYFEDNLKEEFDRFDCLLKDKNYKTDAKIFLKEVKHPERFGIAEIKKSNIINRIINIEEKPKNPKTNLAVTGLYLYDYNVFDVIKELKPSGRGELEITDVNNYFIKKEKMSYSIVKGYWGDMGEPDTLLETANYIKSKENSKSK